jgi:sedoheptulokinase
MEKICVIGLDIGTSTICAVVVDGISGELLETITRHNDSMIASENGWEKIQNPAKILDDINRIVFELEKKYAPIACIGLSGQMHGIVYIDREGNAVSPLYTWQDGRGNLEYKDGDRYADALSKTCGYRLATGFGAVTHYYNSINGLVPASARGLCTIHDYAAMKLARLSKPLMNPTNAASLGCYNMEKHTFDRPAMVAAGVDDTFFPGVSAEIEIIGTTASNIPVALAIGDNQASFMGSVKHNRGSLLVNIGTSGQISLFTDKTIPGLQIEPRPFTKDGFLLVGSSLCGGRSYALLEEFFRTVVQMATGTPPPVMYDLMNKLANDFPLLENKLEISTQFSGTREHPEERASIRNLGVDNFTPRHFVVGILEGTARELYNMYEKMSPVLAQKPEMLIGSGNAIRLGKPLQRIVSEVFGMPIKIPLYKEEAAYGAALFGLVAAGYYQSLDEAQALVQYE